jgi:hypothetical protein
MQLKEITLEDLQPEAFIKEQVAAIRSAVGET